MFVNVLPEGITYLTMSVIWLHLVISGNRISVQNYSLNNISSKSRGARPEATFDSGSNSNVIKMGQ